MFRYAFIIVVTCLLGAGCARHVPATGGETGVGRADTIESQIYQRLATDPTVSDLRLHVTSRDGIVTLTGVVEDPGQRLRAVSVVRSTPGVRAVIDKTHRY